MSTQKKAGPAEQGITITRQEYKALLDIVDIRSWDVEKGICDGESRAYQERQETNVELAYGVLEKLEKLIKKK